MSRPLTRRAFLAAGALLAGAAAGLPREQALAAGALPPPDDGYDLWLRYRPVADPGRLREYRRALSQVVVQEDGALVRSARDEARRALAGLLGRDVPVTGAPSSAATRAARSSAGASCPPRTRSIPRCRRGGATRRTSSTTPSRTSAASW